MHLRSCCSRDLRKVGNHEHLMIAAEVGERNRNCLRSRPADAGVDLVEHQRVGTLSARRIHARQHEPQR